MHQAVLRAGHGDFLKDLPRVGGGVALWSGLTTCQNNRLEVMAARLEVPSAESASKSEKGVWEAFSKALEVKLDPTI